ncbi:MAG: DNA adenine methylase [Candidatus Ranarchaeia archaeon]
MEKYFVLLSGESIDLAKEEIITLLNTNQCFPKGITIQDRILKFSSKEKPDLSNGALYHFICKEILTSSKNINEILEQLKAIDFKKIINDGSFCVRIKRISGFSSPSLSPYLEETIGEIIYLMTNNPVNLKNPDTLFTGIFLENEFIFGPNIGMNLRFNYNRRTPSKRDFFLPTSMHPLLARAMVNLSSPKKHYTFLDPFVGTGGILLEAEMIGCNCIGCDVSGSTIRGARKNITDKTSLIVSDCRHVPLRKIDVISTDPPYGKNSILKGEKKSLIHDFILEAKKITKSNSKICFATPDDFNFDNLKSKIKKYEYFDYYVHRSLTRRIWVIEFYF